MLILGSLFHAHFSFLFVHIKLLIQTLNELAIFNVLFLEIVDHQVFLFLKLSNRLLQLFHSKTCSMVRQLFTVIQKEKVK